MDTATERPPHPGVRFPPPILFAGGWVAGWLLHRFVAPLQLPRVLAGQGGEAVGMFLLVCGLSFAGWGLVTFLRAGTAILPHHPAARLVRHGPYRFTRNPMYAGLTAAYAGLSLVAGLAWPLLVLPIVLVALRVLVVNREERYLQAAFPEAYAEYRRRVRRWV